MAVIEIKDLSHIYSAGTPFEKAALDHVDLSIEEGEFVGVIGHTGSGKSTLIQHLNGLLKPTSGAVFIDGQNIWNEKKQMRRLRFNVGLVFQYPEYQLFEETVYKDIAFGPKNMGLSDEEIDRRVRDAARFTGVSDEMLEKSPFELSGGQKRRVAIAGVIAMDPKVLILDEPTAGLDPKGRDQILGRIKEYHKEIEKLDLKYKFVSDYALEKLGDKGFKTAYMFHLNPHRYYPYYPGFSDDIAQEISEGFTVTYAEIQIAAYMGFKEIYLLGVDFNYSKILDSSGKIVETGSKDYFSDRYILANEKRNIPQLHNSLQAYKKAEVYSKRNGFRIFNATRGGKLEVFERVNFDMLFPLEGDGEI